MNQEASLLTESCLVWVTCVHAPHGLEIDGTHWAIGVEHSVQTSVVVLCKYSLDYVKADLPIICAVSELQHKGYVGSRNGQAVANDVTPVESSIGAGSNPPVGNTGTVTLLASSHFPDGILSVLPSPLIG